MTAARFIPAARLELLAEIIYYNSTQPGLVQDSRALLKKQRLVLLPFHVQAHRLAAKRVA